MEDLQKFLGSEGALEIVEGSSMSLETGGATANNQQPGNDVPAVVAYCQVCGSNGNTEGEEKDDDDTDCSWVPNGAKKERERETQPNTGAFPPGGGKRED